MGFESITQALISAVIQGLGVGMGSAFGFWVVGKGWTEAGKLCQGDNLLTSEGRKVEIGSVSLSKKKVTVYNLTVNGFHTYFVGDLGIWVHNKANNYHKWTCVATGVQLRIGEPEFCPEPNIQTASSHSKSLARKEAKRLVNHSFPGCSYGHVRVQCYKN